MTTREDSTDVVSLTERIAAKKAAEKAAEEAKLHAAIIARAAHLIPQEERLRLLRIEQAAKHVSAARNSSTTFESWLDALDALDEALK